MDIEGIDPTQIREVIESDTVRAAVLTRKATKEMEDKCKGCISITLEGDMKLQLHGFDKLVKKDQKYNAEMYIKVSPEQGQLLYATSNGSDADKVYAELLPALIDMANKTGLQLVDVRAVATESLGILKRSKGVTTTNELTDVLEVESKEEDNQGGK